MKDNQTKVSKCCGAEIEIIKYKSIGGHKEIWCKKCGNHKPFEPVEKECEHCGGSVKIRNPKGFCDHLYYPDNISNIKEVMHGNTTIK